MRLITGSEVRKLGHILNLEGRSTRNERIGWYFYDWANSAFYTTVVTVFFGPYLTSIAKAAADPQGDIHLFGLRVIAGSFFPFTVSISVILQLVTLPIAGALADYTRRKKLLLGLFAYIGAFTTAALFFIQGTAYLLGGVLFITANVSFGASVTIYNSFLPEIASPDERDSVSSMGWAIGYLGGGLLLFCNLLFVSYSNDLGLSMGQAVRLSLMSAGLWWAIFTIIPLLTLRKNTAGPIVRGSSHLASGFKQLLHTLRDAGQHPQALLFLTAYLLYNDGIQAVITLSAQFGQEELGLSVTTLIKVILMIQFIAFLGSIFFGYIARLTGARNAIIISLIIWSAAVFFSYKYLHSELDFYLLGAVIAIVLGGSQALSRSFYSQLIPKGLEAEYFSLYEVSDKGTSWLAPMLFGVALNISGSYRTAILSVLFFFISGAALLFFVRMKHEDQS